MQSNTRFYALVAVVVVVLAGAWYLTRSGAPAPERPAQPAQKTLATQQESGSPLEEPSEREAARPMGLAATGARHSGETAPVKPAVTGEGTIKGTVKNSLGMPVPGATVRLLTISWKSFEPRPEDASLLEVQSGTDGAFSFTKLPVKTQYAITAELGPLFAVDSAYISERETTTEIELSMMSTSFIAGTVVNADGEPVARAAVYAAAWKDQSDDLPFKEPEIPRAVTDDAGAFRFGHVPMGKFKMLVKSPGYAPFLSDWVLSGTQDAMFVLGKGGSIAGHVVNAQTRKPVGKVSVIARTDLSREERRVESAADGAYSFGDLRDTTYRFAIEHETLALSKEPAPVTLAPTQVLDGVEIEIDAGGTVTGFVREAKTGKGIRGARVGLYETTDGRISKDAETDEDGAYTISGLPTANYTMNLSSAEGYVGEGYRERQVVSVTAGQTVSEINFLLDAGTTVSGKVVDDAGAPVGGAHVSTNTRNTGKYASAETDLNGLFTVVGVAPDVGVYVSATKKGLVAAPIGPLDVSAGPAEDVNITMTKEATIAGIVVDKDGKPVSRAEVGAWPVNNTNGYGVPIERSGLSGAFTLSRLVEGDYRVKAITGNRWSNTETGGEVIHVAAGEGKTGVKLVADDAGGLSISGRVTGEDGKPVKDGRVWVQGPNSYGDTQTESDGKYEVTGLQEGRFYINVQARGYTRGDLRDIEAGSTNADLVLKGTGTIEGKVLDAASGQPVVDFEIRYVANASMDPRYLRQMGRGALTHNENGVFKVENAEAGTAVLRVTGKGYAPAVLQVSDIVPGQSKSGIVIKLDTESTVEGRVLDSAGSPIAAAQVFDGPLPMEDYERERQIRATSGPDGSFTLGGLPAGAATISAFRPGYAGGTAQVQVKPGQTAHTNIVLGKGGTVRIRVTENGAPANGAWAGVSTEGGGGWSSQQPDANGVLEVKALAAGNYRVIAGLRDSSGSGQSSRNQTKPVTVTEGEVTEVVFDFVTGTAALAGTVTFGGQPATQAWATLMVPGAASAGEESRHAQIDANGQFRMDNLPPGQANLRVNGSTGGENAVNRQVTVDLVDGQTSEVTVDLGGGGTVNGIVTGLSQDQGRNVALVQRNVNVPARMSAEEFSQQQNQMFSAGSYAGGARVDPATGAFSIPGVQAGSYTAIAIVHDTDGSVRCATAAVTVSEGETTEVKLALPQ